MSSPFVLQTIKVFPATNQVLADKILFSTPQELWEHLMASAEPRLANFTRPATFQQSPEVAEWLASHQPTRYTAQGVPELSLEDLDL